MQADGIDVTEDAFLGGALMMLQPRDGYRAGVDAVLLAAATPVRQGRAERVLDAGSGVGVVGLCVAARVPDAQVTLVENGPELVALANQNVARNGLGDRAKVIEADITSPARALEEKGLSADSFTHVVANPPFHTEGHGRPSRNAIKARAHAMPAGDLAHWVRFAARVTQPGGSLTIVHRADTVGELLTLMDGRFGALRLLPIHPRDGSAAVRVLLQGRKGSRAPLTILPGLILHNDDNSFRPNVADILRHGAPLDLGC